MDLNYQVTVGLRFHPGDASLLRELARRDWTHDEEERSAFDQAAEAAENGTLLVVQVFNKEQLQEVVALFPRAGVRQPAVENLSVPAGT